MRHAVLVLVGIALATPPVYGQAGGAEQHVAALKKSLQDSQQRLRRYEWVETTVISLKGEEKARKQNRVLLRRRRQAAEGAASSQPQPQQQASGGGRRGGRVKKARCREQERGDAGLHGTAGCPDPPVRPAQRRADPGRERRGHDRAETRRGAPAPRIHRLSEGRGHAGDRDRPRTGSRLGLSVSSSLDKQEDQVKLEVREGALPDGTTYTAQTTLDAPAKNIRVVIENSGYRPVSP